MGSLRFRYSALRGTSPSVRSLENAEGVRGQVLRPRADDLSSVRAVKTLGNILWLVLAGIWLAIGYVVAGIVACVLIITIPFGIQSFKLAGFSLWPFGRSIVDRPDADKALGLLGNVIWFITSGWWLALLHLVTGVLLAITVIGIPFAIINFRMAGLALAPFGKEIVKSELVSGQAVVTA